MDNWYFVLRTYSHTDKRQLWKVESRRFSTELQAKDWKDFLKQESPVNEYFIVSMTIEEAKVLFGDA